MDPEPQEFLYTLFLSQLSGFDFGMLSLAILLLLGCSALISGSEVAYFSINSNDYETLKDEESKSASRILKLMGHPEKLLATILISNNFINVAIILLSSAVIDPLLEGMVDWKKILIEIAGVTSLLVLFGEIAPKLYANTNGLTLARLMAQPLEFLGRVFHYPGKALVNSTSFIEQRLNTNKKLSVSLQDLDHVIDLAVNRDTSAIKEVDILKSILKFGNISVTQIMKSRLDIIGVDFSDDFKNLLQIIDESGHSRLPVYQENIDNVTGVIYSKDLLKYLDEDMDFEWQELIRDPYFVPETKKIDKLLKEFQSKRVHMAIVVDEYGGTEGLVTLEDILEEIIGEIQDEFDDQEEIDFEKIGPNTFVFDGKTMLNDVCRVMAIDTSSFEEKKGEAESIAGFVLELTGKMPAEGTSIPSPPFVFLIKEVDERRIKNIQVKINRKK